MKKVEIVKRVGKLTRPGRIGKLTCPPKIGKLTRPGGTGKLTEVQYGDQSSGRN